MKKARRKISHKVTGVLVAAVCCAVLFTGTVSIWSLFTMKNLSTETSMELGNTAADDAEASLEQQAKEQLQNIALEKAAYINEKFAAVEAYVHGIASLAERIYENPEEYPDRNIANPIPGSHELAAQLLWSSRLEEPDTDRQKEVKKLGNIQDLLVQYNANNSMVSSTYLATVSGWMLQADYIAYSKYEEEDTLKFFEADSRQWYQRAMHTDRGETVYSDVIRDAHGGGDCIVCAQPVYHNGNIVAVAGVGSYLETVNNAVLNTTIGTTGYAFVVNHKGQVVVSPRSEGETATHAEKSVDLRESENQELGRVAKDMVSGAFGIAKITLDGQEVYIAYAPLPGLGWSIGTVMLLEEVVAPAKASQQTILTLTDEVATKQDTAIRRMIIILVLLLPVAFLAVGITGALFSRKITEPLQRLTVDVAKLNGGNLDYQIDIATGDEVEDLGMAFNQMTAQLKEYIQNLASVTAEKERIRVELRVASKLQADMLPNPDSALEERKEFNLHAFMAPAKEVGGDFYDFFLIDSDHLALVVADVSGKGVPAALFMVVSRTMLRSSMASGIPLAQTAEEVNNALLLDNHDGMFVTTWMAILTLSTGLLTYVNAGHCFPLVTKNGKYTYLTEIGGMILSGLEDSKYQESSVQLQPGDMLYQYSDGVIEAHDENNHLFGEEGLEELLNQPENLEAGPKEIIGTVWKKLEKHRGSMDQFDDITMLSLCYYGTSKGGEK